MDRPTSADHGQPPVGGAPPDHGFARAAAAGGRPRRRRLARAAELPSPESWVTSADGVHAHRRGLDDLAEGRIQWFEHAAFMAAWGVSEHPAVEVEWGSTDEFTRRYERLRGRSRRAFAAALAALAQDLARAAGGRPRFRSALQVRRVEVEGGEAWTMSWSGEGRATFRVDRDPHRRPPLRVVWLAIGPHGSPNRKGRRTRA